jgi:ligand-binding SRPBCC domain-containing protein
MKVYSLRTSQILPVSIDDAWDYFSNPANLQEITPDYLNFKVTSELPPKMYQGMVVTYKVKPLLGIPLTWVTEITTVDNKKMFIDEQRFGPYKFWHHQHIFKETDSGVDMQDIVHYALPFSFLGSIAHTMFVKKQLDGIFDYRYKFLQKKYPQ